MLIFNVTTEKTNTLLKHRIIYELNFGVFLRRNADIMFIYCKFTIDRFSSYFAVQNYYSIIYKERGELFEK